MSSSPFTPTFDNLVNDQLKEWHCPGVSISVVQDEGSWSQGYGLAQLNPPKPVDTSTLFYAASTTKAQLCALWAIYIVSPENQVQGDAQITFSTPLADIVRDDFILPDPVRTLQVTIEDAVSHRSGMPRHELSYGHDGVKTARELTRNLRHLPLQHEIRTKFEYCNTAYAAASHALEVVTGKPLRQLFREWLWDPLGMSHTYAGFPDASKGEFVAKGYTWTKRFGNADYATGGQYREQEYMDLDVVLGAGGVISTASDYAKWMRCLLSQSTPLSEDIIKDLWTPRMMTGQTGSETAPFEGDLIGYSLGWFIGVYKGHRVLYHPGGIIGGGSTVLLCPDINFGATFLSNGHGSGVYLKGLIFHLLDAALELPETERKGHATCEAACETIFQSFSNQSRKSLDQIYPNMPEKPVVPLTLPLAQYAGTYAHIAYGSLTFKVGKDGDEDILVCDILDRTWPNTWTMHHINAEHWWVKPDPTTFAEPRRAETKIGHDGKVSFGISMESSLLETLFWFEKK